MFKSYLFAVDEQTISDDVYEKTTRITSYFETTTNKTSITTTTIMTSLEI